MAIATNKSSQPLVSVLTPVYNGAEFLSECIESVLAQTYQNWEYTIVDNCSTDGTAEIARRYAAKDSRIRLHQNTEFLRLYGRAPSHLDGHQHLHLASNMLIGHVLPSGAKVRRSFSFFRGEKSVANRLYRSVIDRSLARRHRITDYFFSLEQHLSVDRIQRIAALARDANVELMTHPALRAEYDVLMSDGYRHAVSQARQIPYGAL